MYQHMRAMSTYDMHIQSTQASNSVQRISVVINYGARESDYGLQIKLLITSISIFLLLPKFTSALSLCL